MKWIISLAVCLQSVFLGILGFNIDPVAWGYLSASAEGFGYKVVQRSSSSLLVSAPLAQYSQDRRGQIYNCDSASCRLMSFLEPSFAVNMSLGLTMTRHPASGKTLVCGPTIPKDCKSITNYNGVCWEISRDRFGPPVPSALDECRINADIAFLLDGSGSIYARDFRTMKTFLKDLIRQLIGRNTQFAIAQYATYPNLHYYFDDFRSSGGWERDIDEISQLQGGTNTAKAIRQVVREIFSPNRGSRAKVKKILIVITDGESNDRTDLDGAIAVAQRKNIVRFAIGVGQAFDKDTAREELNVIASSPQKVFKVSSFTALQEIFGTLQDSIFSIEGSHTSGESIEMEMAQEGFSAAYLPSGRYHAATVGAYEWKGGYKDYSRGFTRPILKLGEVLERESYLGYSMAVANTRSGTLTILGAPRYKHTGVVMVFGIQLINPVPQQIGEYFGAEVCAMDVDSDPMNYSDVVLISAPMFMEDDSEGRVYVCLITDSRTTRLDCQWDDKMVLKGVADGRGRFGSSLSPLPDLNEDGLNDLAVGAPLENDGQGSIYIFHGARGAINAEYTQRITGSSVRPGLQFFGLSISQSSFDLSGDSLPDLAVGSKGAVVLLRSKPIVMVHTDVIFSQGKIPTTNIDCDTPLRNKAEICFAMTIVSQQRKAEARVNYTFTLDVTRKAPNYRAYIKEKQREETNSFILNLNGQCFKHNFFIQACPEDALNEISNKLSFTFEGLPSSENLRPSLALTAQTTTYHPIAFEINCGVDNKCVDNLEVDFNFTNSSEVIVGRDDLVNITVLVKNRGENSYNSRVVLTYPPGLSYTIFTAVQGRMECSSLDSEDGLLQGQSDCSIEKPIFKNNAMVVFIVSYRIIANSKLDRKMLIAANATSGNSDHAEGSEHYKMKEIDVKYSFSVSISSSISYTNFSAERNDLQKPAQQSVEVLNFVRPFEGTVVIKVPMRLGSKDIWVAHQSIKIPECVRDTEEEPAIPNFVNKIKKNLMVDCSYAWCMVFKCNVSMGKDDRRFFNISGNLSSGWIEQIGLKSAKFLLISTASVDYDTDQYIFHSTASDSNLPVRRIEMEVEVYAEPDLTKEIVGGSLGGVLLLALVTAGLYKAGFFKSQLTQMIGNEEGDGPGEGGNMPTQEAE